MAILDEPIKTPFQLKNYVDGEWVISSGEAGRVLNPATGQVLARVGMSTTQEVEDAVQAALRAFPEWRATPPLARARCMSRLASLMEAHFEELSRIQTMEHGKTIDESRGETRRGIENVEVSAATPSLMMGDSLEDAAAGIDEVLIRQPLGVFGIIAPFNFPFMVPLWFAPYAVATGNCVVIKPSPSDPISQVKIAELAEEAGVPPGVWNIVHGDRIAASALLNHPDVKGICFVGSTPVGREVYKACGATGKRVIAQCGAKNFIVVMPDAHQSGTMAACMTSFYGNTGQRCLAGANLVLVGEGLSATSFRSFCRDTVDQFAATASAMRIGYGLDDTVQMGPIHDSDKKTRVLAHIERAIAEGASLRWDGRKPKIMGDWPETCFLGPTILDDVTPDMSIAREEVFGPVAAVLKAGTLREAIAMIEASGYGNAACIFTSSGKWAREFRHTVPCGNIGINVGIAAPMAMFPFSGMKDSFFGTLHGQGREAVRFFTESKVVIERWL